MAFDALREGRLPLSPRRWLLDLRHLRAQMAGRLGTVAPPRPPTPSESSSRTTAFVDACRAGLSQLLASGEELRFTQHDRPAVSVLLVLHNRAELTWRCLQSLREHASVPTELVIVDNGSTDETPRLLERVRGAHVIRSGENGGFLLGCNQAAEAARGTYLLFLNNDTELQPGSLTAAIETIERDASVGAVGGRLVFPDGRLQEAGSIIWNDGSCLGYGRGDSPWKPEYSFVRDVDFCSAAFLLTPRRLFLELGGFDRRYQPAYYEDADYCVRLWKAGKRVVYNPRAVVTHVEFGSSNSAGTAVAMQLERREMFVEAHREWLAGQVPPSTEGVLRARDRHRAGQRILVIDDRVPHASIGFGFPRAVSLLTTLADLGHFVTLLPTTGVGETWERVYADIPLSIEVLQEHGSRGVVELFRERAAYYDCIVVSRSHNMALLRAKLGQPDQWMRGARVVYDAEAITAERDIRQRRVMGEAVSEAEAQRLVEAELALARGTDAVLAVSAQERRQFDTVIPGRVHVVSHLIERAPTMRPFHARSGLLFVGSFHELSPNADAVIWLVTRVLPLLRERVGEQVPLTIVGQDPPDDVKRLQGDDVKVAGPVADLEPLYDQARVFVAPTRFAAGIPFKVGHAAAHGLPVVCTSLLADQLEWQDGVELLVADAPASFAAACDALYRDESLWMRIRGGALTRVGTDYSADRFTAALGSALESVRPGPSTLGS
jgi:GT2 family glycosyltransferase